MEKGNNGDISDLVFGVPARLEQIWADLKFPLLWSALAIIALGALAALSMTEIASQRLAQLPVEVEDLISRHTRMTGVTKLDRNLAQLRQDNMLLASDRARLETRIAELERNFGDITASLPAQRNPPAKAEAPVPVKRAEAVPNDAASKQDEPLEQVAAIEQPETQSGLKTTDMKGAGTLTLASRSQFGVDLGSDQTLANLRTRWVKYMEKYGALIAGYEPLVVARDSTDGRAQLHLVAGPFADMAEAATLCAKLRTAGLASCQPASYDGQRMAVR